MSDKTLKYFDSTESIFKRCGPLKIEVGPKFQNLGAHLAPNIFNKVSPLQVPNLANARVSTVDLDISAREFFKERRYVILKYFRHIPSQQYLDLPSKCVHWRD